MEVIFVTSCLFVHIPMPSEEASTLKGKNKYGNKLQSTLVFSKSKGLSEILRDIRASTYQICRIDKKKIINRITTFHKWICNLTPEDRDVLKILWKRGEIAPMERFLLFSTIFWYLLLQLHVIPGIRFSLRDKRLFEISEVEITRVNSIYFIEDFFSK